MIPAIVFAIVVIGCVVLTGGGSLLYDYSYGNHETTKELELVNAHLINSTTNDETKEEENLEDKELIKNMRQTNNFLIEELNAIHGLGFKRKKVAIKKRRDPMKQIKKTLPNATKTKKSLKKQYNRRRTTSSKSATKKHKNK